MRRDKLIVFDLDGVLVDACDWHKEALNKALEANGYSCISNEDHEVKFNGLPTRVKLEKLGIPEDKQKKINEQKQKYTKDCINKGVFVSLEKIELLNALKEQGYYIACYTNCITETAHMMLKKLGVFDLFDDIMTNQRVTNPKPSPEGYIHLMEIFNVTPDKTWIVEDSPKGVKAAKASGANVIIVENATEVLPRRILKECE